MLREGKLIEINKDDLISKNELIIASVVNLCGLVLRADKSIPEKIEDVDIKIIRYKNEKFIGLTGVFTLRKARKKAFIDEK